MRDPIADLKHELLAAADRQQQHAPAVGAGGRRFRLSLSRNRVLMTSATVAVAAAVAFLVTTPWKTAPSLGFLEEVQAALTPPPGEQILHMKWEHIFTSEDPACTTTGGYEVWIDLTPPHAYRAFVPAAGAIPETSGSGPPPLPDPPTGGLPCLPASARTPVEVGGTLDGSSEDPAQPPGPYPVRFVPPNTLARARQLYFPYDDPWAWVRKKISEGQAHREGTTQIYGQTLERVRLGPPASCPAEAAGHCPIEPEYVYFDPETLTLAAWDYARDPMFPLVRQRERYLAFEYLPRTEANLALTDIRAQHPNAIER